jgi:5-amino-6-(5-phospho-D-ribitylamino)uracil phosphatase
MKKILYIADLEETLLNSSGLVTAFSAGVINRYIGEGGLFTIASPCMGFGCMEKAASLDLTIPGIIMNGVCLYSFDTGHFHDVKEIEHSLIPEIETIFAARGCHTIMYAFSREAISIFHREQPSDLDKLYLNPGAYKTCREISRVPALANAVDHQRVICTAAVGPPEQIIPVYENIRTLTELETSFYPWQDFYCLEVYDHTVSMTNAALKLKRRTHASELTVFGGSLQSLPMMEAADYCFAPHESINEARKIANGLTGSRDEDGVARFIQLRHNL